MPSESSANNWPPSSGADDAFDRGRQTPWSRPHGALVAAMQHWLAEGRPERPRWVGRSAGAAHVKGSFLVGSRTGGRGQEPLFAMDRCSEVGAPVTQRAFLEGVNKSGVPEQRAGMGPIKAQSTAVARATASICNAEWAHSGVMSGHVGFVHTFSGLRLPQAWPAYLLGL